MIVVDEEVISLLAKEVFWKNLDTTLLLLNALQAQFSEIKIKKVYEVLVDTIP